MDISVIVPVYNAEDYLHYAMKSLLKQTYKNFEVILVDDGSTDNSGNLCDEYAQKYHFIRTFHKINGGLSDARNYGVEQAHGEFITFLDADDYLEFDALQYLSEVQKEYDVDIVTTILNRTTKYHDTVKKLNIEVKIADKYEALEEILYDVNAQSYSCGKLYRKDILMKRKFPLGRIYEDSYIISEHVYEAEKIALSSNRIYHYIVRIGSIVNSPVTEKKFEFFDALSHTREILKTLYNHDQNLMKALDAKTVIGAFHLINRAEKDKNILNRIKLLTKKMFLSVLLNPKVSKKNKIKYILFLLNPNKYNYMRKFIRSN
mgnify:FL=1